MALSHILKSKSPHYLNGRHVLLVEQADRLNERKYTEMVIQASIKRAMAVTRQEAPGKVARGQEEVVYITT